MRKTVGLLFLISGISILCTIFNREEINSQMLPLDPSTWLSYFESGAFYRSPVFILAVFFLFVNLVVCVFGRLSKNSPISPFKKGGLRGIAPLITHICIILAIIAGTISALFGYVGTVGIFEKQETDTYYNWKQKKYQTLPFTIRVEKLDVTYWPPTVEVEIKEMDSRLRGNDGRKYSLKKGDEIFYQHDKIVFTDFLPDSMVVNNEVYSLSESLHVPAVLFKIYREGDFVSNYWIFAKDAGYRNKILPPYSIKILSNQYLVKSSESLLSIIEGVGATRRVALREIVRPNKSIEYKGLHIYFWGFNQDAYRNYFTGLQISYDPGLWLIWIALGGVLCGICVTFIIPPFRKGRSGG
ncbi:MAG: cytochrome c biogenesis protein ResB, partial [bacterium]